MSSRASGSCGDAAGDAVDGLCGKYDEASAVYRACGLFDILKFGFIGVEFEHFSRHSELRYREYVKISRKLIIFVKT